MTHRIEVAQIVLDTRAETKKKELKSIGFSEKVDKVELTMFKPFSTIAFISHAPTRN